jgi:hypothetical protein
MKSWMVKMEQLSFDFVDKDKLIQEMQSALQEIRALAFETMGEPGVPAKALMGLRWIGKLAGRALGEADD